MKANKDRSNRLARTVLLGMALLGFASGIPGRGAADPAIPYPDALRRAAVEINQVDRNPTVNLRSRGLVVGNGEMNGIVYVAGKDLMLRVSKNDVWDGRVDTSADPALPRVDPATHTLYREKSGNPPSWKQPYPCAVPCADVKLAALEGESGWAMNLDLARGVASAATSAEQATVRALAQSNVFYIHSRRRLELVGVPQKFLPAPTQGTAEGGIRWLCQSIPGDADARGMDVYLVSGNRGPRQAVAVVTSLDSTQPLQRAVQLVKETLAQPEEQLVRAHEASWTDFWAQSGVRLSDPQLERWWYRMVYYFRCFAKKGATGVGLRASFDSLPGWHNSYKFNYNIQQAYFSAGPINHPELVEPLVEVLANYWPRARWFAKTCFVGCDGAFVHSDVYNPHEPDPAQCTTVNRHQSAYIPWGYTLGMQGHISFILWEYYQYRPDAQYLRTKLYPMLRDIALFYCSFLEQCKRDDKGKIIIGPSYFPEVGYFGQDNNAYDIAYINYGLKAARDAAGVLKTDAKLVARIGAILDMMPDYPVLPDPAQENKSIVTICQGAKFPTDDRHGSLIQAVFPAGQVTWFSPPQEKALFERTINLVGRITTHANSPVMLNIARARLSLTTEALSNIAIDFTKHHVEQPNGLFNWKAHGYYIAEQVGVSRMITELLLQSVDGIIRVFPAWPAGKDAEFAGLRAQGGFLVSAKLAGGELRDVTVVSTVGGEVRILNPWPNAVLQVADQKTGEKVEVNESRGIAAFSTQPGHAYILSR